MPREITQTKRYYGPIPPPEVAASTTTTVAGGSIFMNQGIVQLNTTSSIFSPLMGYIHSWSTHMNTPVIYRKPSRMKICLVLSCLRNEFHVMIENVIVEIPMSSVDARCSPGLAVDLRESWTIIVHLEEDSVTTSTNQSEMRPEKVGEKKTYIIRGFNTISPLFKSLWPPPG